MLIAEQVKNLPEVGHSLESAAKALDDEQKLLNQRQRDLDVKRAAFIQELKEDWTAEELIAAGIFG